MPNDTNKRSEQRYSIFRDVVSNITAGITIAYMTFPAEALKKLKQNTGYGLRDLFHKQKQIDGLSSVQTVVKAFKTGVLGSTPDGQPYRFYRGSSVFALNIVPTTFIHLWLHKKLPEFFPQQNASVASDIAKSAFCGVVGAGTATVVENCIVRQQEIKKDRLMDGIRDIYHHRGRMGFWKSYPLIATRDSIFTFSMLWATPEVRKYVNQHWDGKGYEPWAAIMVGVVGAIVSHPFDVVATQMQATHAPITIKEAYHGVVTKFHNSQGFFKGLSYRVFLFTVFANAIPHIKEQAEGSLDNHVKPLLTSSASQVIKNKTSEKENHTDNPQVESKGKLNK